jgi:hypothetical protein
MLTEAAVAAMKKSSGSPGAVLERVRDKTVPIQTPDEFTTSNIAHVG